jgi:hypothetical protein
VNIKEGIEMIDRFPESVQRDYLKKILKGRREGYPVSINGRIVVLKRSIILGYLKNKFQ